MIAAEGYLGENEADSSDQYCTNPSVHPDGAPDGAVGIGDFILQANVRQLAAVDLCGPKDEVKVSSAVSDWLLSNGQILILGGLAYEPQHAVSPPPLRTYLV